MEKLDTDKVFDLMGGWRKYQISVFFILCCAMSFISFQLSFIFVARNIKYRCKIESCDKDFGEYEPDWLQNAVPYEDGTPSLCQFYKPQNNNTCTQFYKNETLICSDFVFQINQTTIVQDFNITCDENLWKLTLPGTVGVTGGICGLPFFGYLSDRFGRRRIIMFGLGLSTVMGLIRSFSPWYYFYVLLEFLDAALGCGAYGGIYILALEIVDTKRRGLVNTILCQSYVTGQVILGLAAWFSSTWRNLLRSIYGSGIGIFILLWFLPESIQWLLSKNKTSEAINTLNSASYFNNGEELSLEVIQSLTTRHEERQQRTRNNACTEILKSRVLLLRIVNCSYAWLCCNFSYYGLMMKSVSLSDDLYTDFIYTALIDIPAYLLLQCTINRIGRKKTLGYSLILAGIFCIFVNVLEKSKWITLVLFITGKFFVTMAYGTISIYTAEMFPTNLRHMAYSICLMSGTLGVTLAPQAPLLESLFKSLPLFIFAGMGVTSGILAFWFPETLNSKLPDEIEEALNIENQ